MHRADRDLVQPFAFDRQERVSVGRRLMQKPKATVAIAS